RGTARLGTAAIRPGGSFGFRTARKGSLHAATVAAARRRATHEATGAEAAAAAGYAQNSVLPLALPPSPSPPSSPNDAGHERAPIDVPTSRQGLAVAAGNSQPQPPRGGSNSDGRAAVPASAGHAASSGGATAPPPMRRVVSGLFRPGVRRDSQTIVRRTDAVVSASKSQHSYTAPSIPLVTEEDLLEPVSTLHGVAPTPTSTSTSTSASAPVPTFTPTVMPGCDGEVRLDDGFANDDERCGLAAQAGPGPEYQCASGPARSAKPSCEEDAPERDCGIPPTAQPHSSTVDAASFGVTMREAASGEGEAADAVAANAAGMAGKEGPCGVCASGSDQHVVEGRIPPSRLGACGRGRSKDYAGAGDSGDPCRSRAAAAAAAAAILTPMLPQLGSPTVARVAGKAAPAAETEAAAPSANGLFPASPLWAVIFDNCDGEGDSKDEGEPTPECAVNGGCDRDDTNLNAEVDIDNDAENDDVKVRGGAAAAVVGKACGQVLVRKGDDDGGAADERIAGPMLPPALLLSPAIRQPLLSPSATAVPATSPLPDFILPPPLSPPSGSLPSASPRLVPALEGAVGAPAAANVTAAAVSTASMEPSVTAATEAEAVAVPALPVAISTRAAPATFVDASAVAALHATAAWAIETRALRKTTQLLLWPESRSDMHTGDSPCDAAAASVAAHGSCDAANPAERHRESDNHSADVTGAGGGRDGDAVLSADVYVDDSRTRHPTAATVDGGGDGGGIVWDSRQGSCSADAGVVGIDDQAEDGGSPFGAYPSTQPITDEGSSPLAEAAPGNVHDGDGGGNNRHGGGGGSGGEIGDVHVGDDVRVVAEIGGGAAVSNNIPATLPIPTEPLRSSGEHGGSRVGRRITSAITSQDLHDPQILCGAITAAVVVLDQAVGASYEPDQRSNSNRDWRTADTAAVASVRPADAQLVDLDLGNWPPPTQVLSPDHQAPCLGSRRGMALAAVQSAGVAPPAMAATTPCAIAGGSPAVAGRRHREEEPALDPTPLSFQLGEMSSQLGGPASLAPTVPVALAAATAPLNSLAASAAPPCVEATVLMTYITRPNAPAAAAAGGEVQRAGACGETVMNLERQGPSLFGRAHAVGAAASPVGLACAQNTVRALPEQGATGLQSGAVRHPADPFRSPDPQMASPATATDVLFVPCATSSCGYIPATATAANPVTKEKPTGLNGPGGSTASPDAGTGALSVERSLTFVAATATPAATAATSCETFIPDSGTRLDSPSQSRLRRQFPSQLQPQTAVLPEVLGRGHGGVASEGMRSPPPQHHRHRHHQHKHKQDNQQHEHRQHEHRQHEHRQHEQPEYQQGQQQGEWEWECEQVRARQQQEQVQDGQEQGRLTLPQQPCRREDGERQRAEQQQQQQQQQQQDRQQQQQQHEQHHQRKVQERHQDAEELETGQNVGSSVHPQQQDMDTDTDTDKERIQGGAKQCFTSHSRMHHQAAGAHAVGAAAAATVEGSAGHDAADARGGSDGDGGAAASGGGIGHNEVARCSPGFIKGVNSPGGNEHDGAAVGEGRTRQIHGVRRVVDRDRGRFGERSEVGEDPEAGNLGKGFGAGDSPLEPGCDGTTTSSRSPISPQCGQRTPMWGLADLTPSASSPGSHGPAPRPRLEGTRRRGPESPSQGQGQGQRQVGVATAVGVEASPPAGGRSPTAQMPGTVSVNAVADAAGVTSYAISAAAAHTPLPAALAAAAAKAAAAAALAATIRKRVSAGGSGAGKGGAGGGSDVAAAAGRGGDYEEGDVRRAKRQRGDGGRDGDGCGGGNGGDHRGYGGGGGDGGDDDSWRNEDDCGGSDSPEESRRGLVCLRPRNRPPPPAAVADDSNWYGRQLLPIVHTEPFYSDPSDVPPRPVVFAGREFRVPAWEDVPFFSRGPGAAQPMARLRMALAAGGTHPPPPPEQINLLGYGRIRGFALVPALSPPPPVEVNAWAERRVAAAAAAAAAAAGRGRGKRMSAAATMAAGGDVGSNQVATLAMDSNTGRLLPAVSPGGPAAAVAAKASGSGAHDQRLPRTAGGTAAIAANAELPLVLSGDLAESLLGTPSLAGLGSSAASGGGGGGGDGAGDGAGSDEDESQGDVYSYDSSGSDEEPGLAEAPPSPKYDDRTCFLGVVALGAAAATTGGLTVQRHQRKRRRCQRALRDRGASQAGGVAAAGAGDGAVNKQDLRSRQHRRRLATQRPGLDATDGISGGNGTGESSDSDGGDPAAIQYDVGGVPFGMPSAGSPDKGADRRRRRGHRHSHHPTEGIQQQRSSQGQQVVGAVGAAVSPAPEPTPTPVIDRGHSCWRQAGVSATPAPFAAFGAAAAAVATTAAATAEEAHQDPVPSPAPGGICVGASRAEHSGEVVGLVLPRPPLDPTGTTSQPPRLPASLPPLPPRPPLPPPPAGAAAAAAAAAAAVAVPSCTPAAQYSLGTATLRTPGAQAGAGQPLSMLSPLRPAGQAPSGPTPPSQRGFRRKGGPAGDRREWLTVAALEVAACCRGALLSDPKHDAVNAVIVAVMEMGVKSPPSWAYPARILILD
ncbi:hypothetical protein Vretifemale_737, partial [Volvox reticuliferus]